MPIDSDSIIAKFSMKEAAPLENTHPVSTTAHATASADTAPPPGDWQAQLAATLGDLPSLLAHIELDIDTLTDFYRTDHPHARGHDIADYLRAAHTKHFPIRVPRAFADRIKPGDPGDPLLRQVLPLPAELTTAAGYVQDPLAETDHLRGQGLLQKYRGRLLVVAHGSCAIHCRYCFRRHFPYETQQLSPHHWQRLAEHLSQDQTLDEVILSGGDPLTLKNKQLAQLNPILLANRHIKRLRIHTRFPIMIPDRIDEGFLTWVRSLPIPLIIVFHINHAQEIDSHVAESLATLKSETGVVLLNQSVLLRDINDTLASQEALQHRLISVGIVPYYLHLLDPVQGAHHFNVPMAEAAELVRQMQQHLPGYMVPRLAREEPGAASKTIILPASD